MKLIIVLCVFAYELFGFEHYVNYQNAIKVPSVKEFQGYTGFNRDKYLKRALSNAHWQNANKYLVGNKYRVTKKFGKITYATVPYDYIMKELKKASEQGVVLAMFQGYRLSSMLTQNKGPHAKKDTAYFARKMMEMNICLGYIETAYGYTMSWYNDKRDYKSAKTVIDAGRNSCANPQLERWVATRYKKDAAKYKAVLEYIHAR